MQIQIFHTRITQQIMKFMEFYTRIKKSNNENLIIPRQNNENYENLNIPQQNYGKHEIPRIPFQN